jgi:serine/threonine-protein kinase
VCDAPLEPLSLSVEPGPPGVCLACLKQARALPQRVPGYLVVRELGRGAMGVVSLAVREADGQPVALKTIIPVVAGSAAQVERFLREAGILRELNHPNIVAFRDLGEAGGAFYFAMDYVRGDDAARLLKQQGPFAVGRAVGLVCQALEGLAHAHARRFVHRDVKPSNLLVAEEGGREVVRLADFGLARVYQASHFSGLTMAGEIGGTVAFMPPEQITEYREARPPADQYSAAATLYNLLTGAFVYDLPAELKKQLRMILEEDPVPIRSRRKDVPKGLAEVIHRALAREPGDRWPDVTSLGQALQPFRA